MFDRDLIPENWRSHLFIFSLIIMVIGWAAIEAVLYLISFF